MSAAQERGWVELAHAPAVEWAPLPATGWPFGAQARVLSVAPASGAFTGVVRLDAGWRRPSGHCASAVEVLVLSGCLRLGDGVRGLGWYGYLPAGVTSSAWVAESDVELLLCARDCAPDFAPGPGPGPVAGHAGVVSVDTETVEWVQSSRPGIAPGLAHKLLRHDPATGEAAFLGGVVPSWRSPYVEFHTAIEEIYAVSGDITLGNSGRMDAGSYLWRPPYIGHGPFSSESGAVIYVWVPGELVNHAPPHPGATPEENRRAYETNGAPPVAVTATGGGA